MFAGMRAGRRLGRCNGSSGALSKIVAIPAQLSDPALARQMPGAYVALSRRKQGFESLGSANNFNDVVALEACRLATSPTFLQWTVLSKIGSRPPCDRRLEEAEDWRGHRRAGIGVYL